MATVNVKIRYCRESYYEKCYEELAIHIKRKHPDVNIIGYHGPRSCFEVQINGHLVHSKLRTLAYPDYDDLCDLINDAKTGRVPQRMCKQQPITPCAIA
ncbi:migration and invasion enhancer 1 [Rhynchophorus ferrugineus]|uniref:Migration and invasion enhancer 1 n=1 Tax=Rhynchophorus ferrugineus TaxID=354439 RepID=A0A834IP40_RHYFE|nr:hypothetical protein GWI33_022899 [Rhynchophorus ferrugineus]